MSANHRTCHERVSSAEQLKSILGVVVDVSHYLLRKPASERSVRLSRSRCSFLTVELTEAEIGGHELVRAVITVRTERPHRELGLTTVDDILCVG